jgi:hypothetical protein
LNQGKSVTKIKRSQHQYSADRVWAVVCAAYRINGGYFKQAQVTADGKQITRPANRDLVQLYLADSDDHFVTQADYEQGRKCRQDLANSTTMAALKNRLTEWGELTARMVNLETVTTDYEISVITSMPKSWEQNTLRENTDSRLAHCNGELVGRPGERVEVTGEIVRCVYSNRFNTFYTTLITQSNQQVFFAYRERLNTGRRVKICGRVKRHADRATQLSRVQLQDSLLVEQEAV